MMLDYFRKVISKWSNWLVCLFVILVVAWFNGSDHSIDADTTFIESPKDVITEIDSPS